MYINIEEINRNDFRIEERALDGVGKVYLIVPTFTKHKWSDADRHLRSLLLDESGKVISASFMKFHNYGEVPELDRLTAKAIAEGDAVFPEKMDGSLIIRSVFGDMVHFRTRGSHTMGEGFDRQVMELVTKKYPRLLDATLDQRYSLLFEYTGPENQIVVPYDEARLTALGVMDLSADPPEFVSSPILVRDMERVYGTPAVRFHDLGGTLQEITEQIRGWKGSEGIVVWSTLPNGQMLLCKIKAAEYLAIHTLKFAMNEEKVRQFCWYHDILSLDKLRETMNHYGIDFETVSFVEPFFKSYLKDRNRVSGEVRNFVQQIQKNGLVGKSRKEAALKLQEMTAHNAVMFNVGIEYLFGEKNLQKFVDGIVLGVAVKQLENLRKETEQSLQDLANRTYQVSDT